MVHIDDILSLEKRMKSPNLKVKSVFLDLKDSRVVTMVQALGIIYVKITEPYWHLVTSCNNKTSRFKSRTKAPI